MKKVWITTLITSAAVLLVFGLIFSFGRDTGLSGILKVGFIYEGDGSTPYTYNFALAQGILDEEYAKVQTISRSNVRDDKMEEAVREVIRQDCGIIFTNSYSDEFRKIAAEFPDIQFCQASYLFDQTEPLPKNYHTFKGETYQGRYVSGIAAGMKLSEMIDNRVIGKDEALVGFVAAYPTEEVISGFTAFFLGIRSVCPTAEMRVRYTYSWSSFSLEKATAHQLIEEGCHIIGQHTDTIGPALACEEAYARTPVYHVGYNTSMMDVAPSSSLVSTRSNWTPYILGAVEAVLANRSIESYVEGNVHGNDMSAGFDLGWVEILELNNQLAAYGTQEKMDAAIDALSKNRLQVFKGDYIGADPNDPDDIIDLNNGYKENKDYSSPTFHYILKDVITIEE